MLSVRVAFTIALLLINALVTRSQENASQSPTVDQIVTKLVEHNLERAARLKGYTGTRTYHCDYHGFPGSKSAEMVVEARYTAPSEKQFRIVSESGSKLLLNHVLHRLLTSEQEALNPENQKQTAMTPDNYDFKLEREETIGGRPNFVLHVEPRRKNKFLFRGRIWIDAADYAVSRIEAQPAKNPSFWISKTNVEQRYTKVGAFWLPAQNISKTDVRVGGGAILTIEYRDYVVSTNVADDPQQGFDSRRAD